MKLAVRSFRRTESFDRDVRRAPPEVVQEAQSALDRLQENPSATSIRLKTLQGYPKPQIFKIDVNTNHCWQITFELDGDTAVLLRLGTHKQIEQRPR